MGSVRVKPAARMAVDALMAADFVLVMATALVEEAPHEYLGLALFALVIVHIVQNRRWFAALPRGRWTAVRTLQAATVLGLVACLIGQVASAVVLSKHALAFLPAIPGTALARRVHMMCSYWSFVFAFAHAGLQMKGVVARMCREKTPSPVMKWAARIACAAIAAIGAVSFVQLDLAAYLTGRVQFAAGDPSIALSCARWASVAVLVAGALYLLRSLIEKTGERRS